MNYKKKIIEMIEQIKDYEFLENIYWFVRVAFEKAKK